MMKHQLGRLEGRGRCMMKQMKGRRRLHDLLLYYRPIDWPSRYIDGVFGAVLFYSWTRKPAAFLIIILGVGKVCRHWA